MPSLLFANNGGNHTIYQELVASSIPFLFPLFWSVPFVRAICIRYLVFDVFLALVLWRITQYGAAYSRHWHSLVFFICFFASTIYVFVRFQEVRAGSMESQS